jgi:hypothetical protein
MYPKIYIRASIGNNLISRFSPGVYDGGELLATNSKLVAKETVGIKE